MLEPLSGYLTLAEKLYTNGVAFSEAWNFGPREEEVQSVKWIVEKMASQFGEVASWITDDRAYSHEAHYLKLDCSKARMVLGWRSYWGLEHTLSRIVDWHKSWLQQANMLEHTRNELNDYMRFANEVEAAPQDSAHA